MFSNLFAFFSFSKKKFLFFFPIQNSERLENNLIQDLNLFFDNFSHEYFTYFKDILYFAIKNYCDRQKSIENSINCLVDKIDPKKVLVDQLRFGVPTVLSYICKQKKVDVILYPHGSISTPNDKISDIVLKVCARGLIFSNLADYVISQSKISFEAIKFYRKNTNIIKSYPLMFGRNSLTDELDNSKFTFLHASTPKSLSKWPYIYENYNEYIGNIKKIIEEIGKFNNIKLIIRFREGPECSLETFLKIININKYKFVEISYNKDFFDDLSKSNCLISYSSTAIEESIGLNKKVLIFSKYKNYKHINYNLDPKSIYYTSKKNIHLTLNQIIKEKNKIINKIYWNEFDY